MDLHRTTGGGLALSETEKEHPLSRAPYSPAVGDAVVIEAVQSGSRDVIGLPGTVLRVDADAFVVDTRFSPTQSVAVLATQVRPA